MSPISGRKRRCGRLCCWNFGECFFLISLLSFIDAFRFPTISIIFVHILLNFYEPISKSLNFHAYHKWKFSISWSWSYIYDMEIHHIIYIILPATTTVSFDIVSPPNYLSSIDDSKWFNSKATIHRLTPEVRHTFDDGRDVFVTWRSRMSSYRVV